MTLEDFKKGRITDIGTDEAASALDDYWRDAESEMNLDEARRDKEDENAG